MAPSLPSAAPSPGRRAAALLAVAVALTGCGPLSSVSPSSGDGAAAAPQPRACSRAETAGPRLAPEPGRPWLGVDLDWRTDSAAAYRERLGASPAAYAAFAPVGLRGDDRALVDDVVDQVAEARAALVLTLEPYDGLAAVTPEVARHVAEVVRGYGERGVPVLVRFGQEMNGSWYPWGQRPREYVAAFRLLAAEVHARAPLAAMLWAPNYGGGYPFRDGRQAVVADDPSLADLDVDGDGRVDQSDDPYAPYWPGDDAVDWVGMSLFHWGDAYPWDRPSLPEPGKLVAQLRGEYAGRAGDARVLPDFVGVYAGRHGKPLAITETAARWSPPASAGPATSSLPRAAASLAPDSPALAAQARRHVDTAVDGLTERQVKAAWWQQVLAPDLTSRLPGLGLVSWLEWDRDEVETRGRVDWRVTADPATATAFRAAVPPSWVLASGLDVCRRA